MDFIKKYFGDLFVNQRFYLGILVCMAVFIIAFFIPVPESIPVFVFSLFVFFCLIDYALLFFTKRKPFVKRLTAARFGNGDENKIEWKIKNEFIFPVHVELIDEWPEQLQIRDLKRNVFLRGRQQKRISWYVKPLQRGEYRFGNIHLYISTPLRIVCRRFTMEASQTIPVYPAFRQLYKYELLSHSFIAGESGSSRMRKVGQSMEFEQIKEYVSGDDIRTLNWKASARKGGLMVNHFMEERSQQVYCLIDKGRLMKMPFDGLTLLDHAINSCLMLSNICLKKQDRVGVITFSHTMGSLLAADRKPVQTESILQLLYKQQTDFLESDFEMLYQQIRNKIKHRSLLILFTNFESLSGLNRQIEYLRSIARHHLLLVIFFENTELKNITSSPVKNVEDVYIKTVAEKFAFEKRLIARELAKYGILSILTSPQKLTINTINKYLELKARQAI
ncbi:MAG: DUF58 domain-containing protein [Ginsengibacter sp.]